MLATGTSGAVALLPSRDGDAKVALGIGGVVAGILSGGAALEVSQSAAAYAQDDCQAVLSAPERAP